MRRIGNSQGFVIPASVMAGLLPALTAAALILSPGRSLDAANVERAVATRSIGELKRTATIHLGKTADWVAITADAVWVGSTGPFAVHRIDPTTNTRVATGKLQGEPCSGLATGLRGLWVPLCGKSATLARGDLKSAVLTNVVRTGPAAAEGGVTTSADSVSLVVDNDGSLARID